MIFIRPWLLVFLLNSIIYCEPIAEAPQSTKRIENEGSNCVCFDKQPYSETIVEQIDPDYTGVERLVVFYYKKGEDEIYMYVPNKGKQLLIPDLVKEEEDLLLLVSNNLQTTIFGPYPNSIHKQVFQESARDASNPISGLPDENSKELAPIEQNDTSIEDIVLESYNDLDKWPVINDNSHTELGLPPIPSQEEEGSNDAPRPLKLLPSINGHDTSHNLDENENSSWSDEREPSPLLPLETNFLTQPPILLPPLHEKNNSERLIEETFPPLSQDTHLPTGFSEWPYKEQKITPKDKPSHIPELPSSASIPKPACSCIKPLKSSWDLNALTQLTDNGPRVSKSAITSTSSPPKRIILEKISPLNNIYSGSEGALNLDHPTILPASSSRKLMQETYPKYDWPGLPIDKSNPKDTQDSSSTPNAENILNPIPPKEFLPLQETHYFGNYPIWIPPLRDTNSLTGPDGYNLDLIPETCSTSSETPVAETSDLVKVRTVDGNTSIAKWILGEVVANDFKSINIFKLEERVTDILIDHGITFRPDGVLVNSEGDIFSINSLRLRPIYIGDDIAYDKVVSQLDKSVQIPTDLRYLKLLMVSLNEPSEVVLGVIPVDIILNQLTIPEPTAWPLPLPDKIQTTIKATATEISQTTPKATQSSSTTPTPFVKKVWDQLPCSIKKIFLKFGDHNENNTSENDACTLKLNRKAKKNLEKLIENEYSHKNSKQKNIIHNLIVKLWEQQKNNNTNVNRSLQTNVAHSATSTTVPDWYYSVKNAVGAPRKRLEDEEYLDAENKEPAINKQNYFGKENSAQKKAEAIAFESYWSAQRRASEEDENKTPVKRIAQDDISPRRYLPPAPIDKNPKSSSEVSIMDDSLSKFDMQPRRAKAKKWTKRKDRGTQRRRNKHRKYPQMSGFNEDSPFEDPDFRIIGGAAATFSGLPISNRGRAGFIAT